MRLVFRDASHLSFYLFRVLCTDGASDVTRRRGDEARRGNETRLRGVTRRRDGRRDEATRCREVETSRRRGERRDVVASEATSRRDVAASDEAARRGFAIDPIKGTLDPGTSLRTHAFAHGAAVSFSMHRWRSFTWPSRFEKLCMQRWKMASAAWRFGSSRLRGCSSSSRRRATRRRAWSGRTPRALF